MKWKNKGKEFDTVAQIICDKKHKYYVWGAGVFGQSFYEIFKDKINIVGFIDSASEKQGKFIGTTEIFSPNLLLKGKEIKVIVANGWITDCFKVLNDAGYIYNADYFHANDFMAIYMLYKEDKIYTISVNFSVTTKCTLRCEKCMALIPYVKEPRNIPLDEIKEDLDAYFKWVDYVGILGLGGGDVLINPQLAEILEYVCNTYVGRKANAVEIYTNAIIMPSERILNICKKYNVIVRFTDYSKEIPGRQKIDEMISILDRWSIRYDRAVWDTWYDIGFPQESNGIIGSEALMAHYNKCIAKLCMGIVQKKLYFCNLCGAAVLAGYCEPKSDDYFDLEDYNDERKKEFIEFNAGYCENGYLSYCIRCNGYQNINDKFVPVGKQLRHKEDKGNEIC